VAGEEGHKEEDREEAEGEAGGTGWRRWGRIEFGRIRLNESGSGEGGANGDGRGADATTYYGRRTRRVRE
jgi:hypothetical protein